MSYISAYPISTLSPFTSRATLGPNNPSARKAHLANHIAIIQSTTGGSGLELVPVELVLAARFEVSRSWDQPREFGR